MQAKRTQKSWGGNVFDLLNVVVLLLVSVATVVPFLHIISVSLASPEQVARDAFTLFPTEISFDAYRFIFTTNTIVRSLLVTVFITVAGTLINIIMTSLLAYPLSKSTIQLRKPVMLIVVFSMMFSGGLIPTYLLIKNLGLIDSYWSLLLPGAIHAFYLIILKNFFQQLPDGLEESAKIDGCNDLFILVRIVVPLSLPSLATLTLFYAVLHWNTFMAALLYMNDANKWPIQVLLRSLVLLAEGSVGDSTQMNPNVHVPPEQLKMAVITVATLPILAIYPFLQKHFAKGMLLGSVKG